jgi:hypothetical protein
VTATHHLLTLCIFDSLITLIDPFRRRPSPERDIA